MVMTLVTVLNVQVLDNPSGFLDPFKFDITFECTGDLEQDLEWKIVYVGSAESAKYDQELDSVMMGPVPIGINKFVFQVDPPKPELIPPSEMRGVTVVLLTCSYLEQEFIRVGYYVDNDYVDENLLESPPEHVDVSQLKRNILADKPRVTKLDIKWDSTQLKVVDIPPELLDIQVEDEWTSEESEISLDKDYEE